MRFPVAALAISTLISFNIYAKSMSYIEVKNIAKSVLQERDYGLTEMKINDITDFCPSYNSFSQDEKEDFFAHLIATMARHESSFNPQTSLLENNGNVSAGLLQISFGSINPTYSRNGCSAIKSASDLRDAKKNIQCGLGIISTLVKNDESLAKSRTSGASRYWSVLRSPYSVHIKSLNKTVKVGKKSQVIKELKNSYANCK